MHPTPSTDYPTGLAVWAIWGAYHTFFFFLNATITMKLRQRSHLCKSDEAIRRILRYVKKYNPGEDVYCGSLVPKAAAVVLLRMTSLSGAILDMFPGREAITETVAAVTATTRTLKEWDECVGLATRVISNAPIAKNALFFERLKNPDLDSADTHDFSSETNYEELNKLLPKYGPDKMLFLPAPSSSATLERLKNPDLDSADTNDFSFETNYAELNKLFPKYGPDKMLFLPAPSPSATLTLLDVKLNACLQLLGIQINKTPFWCVVLGSLLLTATQYETTTISVPTKTFDDVAEIMRGVYEKCDHTIIESILRSILGTLEGVDNQLERIQTLMLACMLIALIYIYKERTEVMKGNLNPSINSPSRPRLIHLPTLRATAPTTAAKAEAEAEAEAEADQPLWLREAEAFLADTATPQPQPPLRATAPTTAAEAGAEAGAEADDDQPLWLREAEAFLADTSTPQPQPPPPPPLVTAPTPTLTTSTAGSSTTIPLVYPKWMEGNMKPGCATLELKQEWERAHNENNTNKKLILELKCKALKFRTPESLNLEQCILANELKQENKRVICKSTVSKSVADGGCVGKLKPDDKRVNL